MFQNCGIHQAISASCNAEDQENKQAQNSANKQESTKSSELAVRSALMQLETPPKVCNICGKTFTSVMKYNRHKIIHKEKRFACDVCSYKFPTPSHLRAHIRSHTGERPFSCEQCGNQFAQKQNKMRHIRMYHNLQPGDLKNKMLSSDKILFDATANSTQELQVNKQPDNSIHIQESTQFAEEATKSLKTQARFKQKHDESEHIKVHHTALSYTCIICNKSFSSLPHLNEHMLNHICIICGVAFASDSELLTHFNSSLHLLKFHAARLLYANYCE